MTPGLGLSASAGAAGVRVHARAAAHAAATAPRRAIFASPVIGCLAFLDLGSGAGRWAGSAAPAPTDPLASARADAAGPARRLDGPRRGRATGVAGAAPGGVGRAAGIGRIES